jgi:hypothetical protein
VEFAGSGGSCFARINDQQSLSIRGEPYGMMLRSDTPLKVECRSAVYQTPRNRAKRRFCQALEFGNLGTSPCLQAVVLEKSGDHKTATGIY